MTAGPLGVHHVSVMVAEVEPALRFYVEGLGLTVRGDRPNFATGGAWLDAGGQQVHVVHGAPPPALGQHFALRFADLDAVVARLRACGYGPSEPEVGLAGQISRVSDPDGNSIELSGPG